jgi:glutamate--cysteine ligase
MYNQLNDTITRLAKQKELSTLLKYKIGIEKEGLRVDYQGNLSQSPHPSGLGSSLTHPHITTDYSESMVELITAPFEDVDSVMEQLLDIHRFCYQNINNEMIWAASMPCMIEKDSDVPIATYGSSNIGRIKYVYRKGLSYRYGRKMQSITGIHYNFSLGNSFWEYYQGISGSKESLTSFKSASYLALIRNFIRNSWLICYLFGASPALCKSFLSGRDNPLDEWDVVTAYLPHATSLRMSNLGYQSDAQNSLYVCYNKLNRYIETLQEAVDTEYQPYRKFNNAEAGKYNQLNSNLLQIENEFYSHVRPKQLINHGERPLEAMKKRGVEYVEVRLLDVNPFLPLGIDSEQAYFLNTFLLYCLLLPSPELSSTDFSQIKENRMRVLFKGREPGFQLDLEGEKSTIYQAGSVILDRLKPVGELLDKAMGGDSHLRAIIKQQQKLDYPERLPSTMIIDQMKNRKESYVDLILNLSREHQRVLSHGLTREKTEYFKKISRSSIEEQKLIEEQDNINFDQYVKSYFT